ncbi:hypothetical protein E8E11_009576 [Didymella keratinophila]|nr:hypothetical protein E8E11_009576 [Didymella keratinophila]
MSSSIEEVRTSSNIAAAPSSKPESPALSTTVSQPAPPTAGPSLSVTSASTPAGDTSDSQPDASPTSTSGDVSEATSLELGSSIVPTPRPSTLASETNSEVVSTAPLTPQPTTTVTTSIEQQLSSSIDPSSEVVDLSTTSPAVSAVPPSALTPILPSTTTLTSASDPVEVPSSTGPESTSVITPSISGTSAAVETLTSSDTASSILISSTSGPPATSSSELATSAIEGTLPVPSSTFLLTSGTPSSLLSQPSSNIVTDLSTTGSEISSAMSNKPTKALDSVSLIVLPSSTQVEQAPTVSDVFSQPSSTTGFPRPTPLPTLTTSTHSSPPLVPTIMSESITTQTPQTSEAGTFVTSSLEAVSTASVGPSLPTSVLAPSATTIPAASISSALGTASSGFSSTVGFSSASSGTSVLASTTATSEMSPSLLPSETLATTAVPTSVSAPVVTPSTTVTHTLSASSEWPSSTTIWERSTSPGLITASESRTFIGQISSTFSPDPPGSSLFSASSGESPTFSSLPDTSQDVSSQHPTSSASPSMTPLASAAILTSETVSSTFSPGSFLPTNATSTVASSSKISTLFSSQRLTRPSDVDAALPSSIKTNGTRTIFILPTTSGTITATFSIVYISSVRSSVLDLSTVAFSLFSSVSGATENSTDARTSGAVTATRTLQSSGTHIPASETLVSSSKLDFGANPTSTTQVQSLTATVGMSGSINSTRTSTVESGITFSRSSIPTGTAGITAPTSNATHAETLQTSSAPVAFNSTTANLLSSTRTGSISGTQSNRGGATSTSTSDEVSSTSGAGGEMETSTIHHGPTSTPSQTVSAGSPPSLTTSQTAGVAVGATTGLLIAVVAAIFVARRYRATKHGRRASTGSIYPKVAYLYDPKTGGDGGDAEALMSGATGGPSGSLSGAARCMSPHTQRHSTGTIPVARFTSPGNPFRETVRDPAVHRYSEYVRVDTARALSAAVAGYGGTPGHTSSYTKYPSEVTNPFSDHVIPSPTFAPFSPGDIRRPELKTPRTVDDGRASMYPPVSPYGYLSNPWPSSGNDTRRQTIDSDPFADPFEHDLLLHVDEQNRTSDSVTIFAPSPNLKTPRTPRTPVGPKLPVRQPNGMTSARSLLSPVAAKYLHKAHEVKIPRKSVASPVLVQVGRSPVIKPFSPPPAAPEPLGWDDIKRNSEKHFSDEQSVPAPLRFASPVMKKNPVPASHMRTKPSLTGAGHTLLAGNGLPLTVRIPHRYSKSVGLDVPKMHGRPDPAHEDLSSDPVVREKRSRELRFADPALIGKDF